jgi:NAD(P)H-dependent flavin oxidoreductase YrpB (nitropropane dioxygenase family)
VPTSILLPEVCDAVDIPVLGAGGFFDGRGLVAALAYGASGIAMGTRFLLSRESTVPEAVKKIYLETGVTGTVVTRSIDGYPQRVIRTPVVDRLERSGRVMALVRSIEHAFAFRAATKASFTDLMREGLAMKKKDELTIGQLAMAASAPMMTKAALVEGRPDVGVLPTGQAAGVMDDLPSVADIIDRIVREAESTLDRLGGAS